MMEVEKSGYIHLYTGNGKGKTTAAMGLALRAAGSIEIADLVTEMKEIKHYYNLGTKARKEIEF